MKEKAVRKMIMTISSKESKDKVKFRLSDDIKYKNTISNSIIIK